MEIEEFNKLNLSEQLTKMFTSGKKIDNIFPWFGSLRIVSIYSFNDYLVEIECDLTTEKITYAKAFNDLDYLEKYPHYFKEKMHKIKTELNLQ